MPAREFTVYKFKTYQECVAWVESKFHEKIDGNIYSKNNTGTVVKIGSQVWMTKNLNIDRFRNGDLIPEIKTNEEWKYACDNNLPACRTSTHNTLLPRTHNTKKTKNNTPPPPPKTTTNRP